MKTKIMRLRKNDFVIFDGNMKENMLMRYKNIFIAKFPIQCDSEVFAYLIDKSNFLFQMKFNKTHV